MSTPQPIPAFVHPTVRPVYKYEQGNYCTVVDAPIARGFSRPRYTASQHGQPKVNLSPLASVTPKTIQYAAILQYGLFLAFRGRMA